MLSSPIILPDYPVVAPESPGDFCDATEMDEMLMLRLQTLTDGEKREGRATDLCAARLIDRADGASPEVMGRLHGAIRRYADAAPAAEVRPWEALLNPPDEPAPQSASVVVGGTRVARGSRVRLQPTRRADSMDLCLRGRQAVVSGVYRTLEGAPYVAVIPTDDPLAIEDARYRRALFFHPEEIVPLDGPPAAVEDV
jgi:hypothetical protein